MVDVEVGQTVIVLDGYSRGTTTRGTVVKIGRVWIDVHREGRGRGWRFRKDNQTDGGTIGHRTLFYTLEQWAEKLLTDAASTFLREQDVTIGWGSPWRGRQVELATLMGWTPPAADGEPKV